MPRAPFEENDLNDLDEGDEILEPDEEDFAEEVAEFEEAVQEGFDEEAEEEDVDNGDAELFAGEGDFGEEAEEEDVDVGDMELFAGEGVEGGLGEEAEEEDDDVGDVELLALPLKEAPPRVRAKRIMRSTRAGLTFPVGRIHRKLKIHATRKMRLGDTAAVYLAGVLEYLTAEVLDLTGDLKKQFPFKRILPRHLQLAIRADAELDALITATIPGGGVPPHIHRFLTRYNRARPSKPARK